MVNAVVKRLAERDDEVRPGAMAYSLSTPIDSDALDEALAGESSVKPGLVIEGNPAMASEAKPVTVWVLGEVATNDFKRAVKEQTVTPQSQRRGLINQDALLLRSLLGKPEDEPYTDAEMQQALRLLLRRVGSA